MPVTTLKLECVGMASAESINAQCRVIRFETALDDAARKITITTFIIGVRDFTPEGDVNTAWYDVPEGVVCCYSRKIQLQPPAFESKWFIARNGKVEILGDASAGTAQYAELYLKEYLAKGYQWEMRG